MSIKFNKWCEDRAAEIMEEEYGPNWMDTCGDDSSYDAALEQAGYEFPFEDYEEDDEKDIDYYQEYLKTLDD